MPGALPAIGIERAASLLAPARARATRILGAAGELPASAGTPPRLLRTGDPAVLDARELLLRTGQVDEASKSTVGSGLNGERHAYDLHDPATGTSLRAVHKPIDAQAAQEELAWRIARELGIDHLVPTVARRADGDAWIQFIAAKSPESQGMYVAERLESLLATGYRADEDLGLTEAQALRAARTDRQLLQLLDYVLANSDRHLGNALADAKLGAAWFIDFGHMGRGAREGADALEPSMRGFGAGPAGGRVDIDPEVLAYAQARITPARLKQLHAEAFDPARTPLPHENGARTQYFLREAASERFRQGIADRFEHAVRSGGFTHRPFDDGPLEPMMGPGLAGVGQARAPFGPLHRGGGFGGAFGGGFERF